MTNGKKKNLAALKKAMSGNDENAITERKSGVKMLVEAYVNNPDLKKRERAVRKVVRQRGEIKELLEGNAPLVTSEIEQALVEMATGYTAEESVTRLVNGRKSVEKRVRQIPPNQKAIEFYLTNKADYSNSPERKSEDGSGKIAEIMEALKNVK